MLKLVLRDSLLLVHNFTHLPKELLWYYYLALVFRQN